MKQEDKQLLLKDLCMRLPYGVICQMEDKLIINESPYYDYPLSEGYIELFRIHKDFYIKPYLRPMSSMTEIEVIKFNNIPSTKNYQIVDGDLPWDVANCKQIDWLNGRHFDYRGLIKKGLAIEVTEENNPYK